MARPRTPIRSHGAIHTAEISKGKWRARARYRFDDGRLRQVERFAATEAKAKSALRSAMTQLEQSTGTDINRTTRLSRLADRFLESKQDRAPRTVDTYRQTIEHLIRPKIGDLSVSEATPDRLQRYIDATRLEHGPGAAKAARAVLSGMMGLATRADAVRSNPVRELSAISRGGTGAKAIPLDQVAGLLAKVREDERLRALDLPDLIEFIAATGCRVGEACALAWEDVDLEGGIISIRANVVRARGIGLVRQGHAKTRAGSRTIQVPATLVDNLKARRDRIPASALVFPTALGNLRDPRNTSRDWANARVRLGYPEVTTHAFRKTVATGLDKAGLSAREIADYLGHENPSLTQDVYMAKSPGGIRAANAIETMIRQ